MAASENTNHQKHYSIASIILALVGIFFAILKFDTLSKEPKPTVSHKIAFNLSNLLKKKPDISINQIEDAKIKESFLQKKKTYERAAYTFGGIGLCLGAIAWIRREHRRLTAFSIVLSLVAIAHEQALWAIGVAFVLLILSAFH